MRKLALPGSPLAGQELQWLMNAVRDIEQASEEDVAIIADNFTVNNLVTQTRTLDASTATLADLVAVFATFLTDIKKRGANRVQ